MEPISESGYCNSNRFARIFLESIQEITGRNGLNAVLNFANLPQLVNNLPPDDLERGFDFAYFARINQALEELYGVRGGRGLALRIGRTTFEDVLKDYGEMAGVTSPEFRVLPLRQKIRFGLEAMARVFSEKSDQTTTVDEQEDKFIYVVQRCPVCWDRTAPDHGVCYYLVGLLQEGLHWVSGGKEFQVTESRCIALGDAACEFVISKQPLE